MLLKVILKFAYYTVATMSIPIWNLILKKLYLRSSPLDYNFREGRDPQFVQCWILPTTYNNSLEWQYITQLKKASTNI